MKCSTQTVCQKIIADDSGIIRTMKYGHIIVPLFLAQETAISWEETGEAWEDSAVSWEGTAVSWEESGKTRERNQKRVPFITGNSFV